MALGRGEHYNRLWRYQRITHSDEGWKMRYDWASMQAKAPGSGGYSSAVHIDFLCSSYMRASKASKQANALPHSRSVNMNHVFSVLLTPRPCPLCQHHIRPSFPSKRHATTVKASQALYAAVMAFVLLAPRWRLDRWEICSRFSAAGAFCTTSSPSVRIISMWHGLDTVRMCQSLVLSIRPYMSSPNDHHV